MVNKTSTSSLDRSFVVESIRHALDQWGIAFTIQRVTSRLAPPAETFVFGGALRNAVLSAILNKAFSVKDLDFVVFGLASDDELQSAFANERPRRNSFGGMKLSLEGITVDIWRAELELKIAGQQPQVASIDDFLECVTLTTDAILYNPDVAVFSEQAFLHTMAHRTIDLGKHSRWIDPWVPYHLAHLAYVRELTGFSISDEARARVSEAASESVVEQAVQYLESRGKCVNPREAVLLLVSEAT
jgi:hypothetical protein